MEPFKSTLAEVKIHLESKRKKYHEFKGVPEQVQAEKKQLLQKQKDKPEQYPAFLGQLLDLGYLNLYHHLIKMKAFGKREDCITSVKSMMFSEIAHIVLETRDVVFRTVQKAIPSHCKNILFLLGGSGAGKSTTLCFLRGDPMELSNFQYQSKKVKETTEKGIIGSDLGASCTFLPNVSIVNNLAIVDFPGFEDSNGPVISLGMECALKALVKEYHPKIMVLEAITNIDGRFAAVGKLAQRLKRILGNKENCLLGITKYSKNPHFAEYKKLLNQEKCSIH